MKKIILLPILCIFSIVTFAQASGGQIRRSAKIQRNVANRTAPPSRNAAKTYTAREMYEKGQRFYDKGNYREAIKWFTKAAKNGYPDAQSELGFMYMNGEGVPVNKSEGAKWLTKAGDNGDAMAQQALGYMYKNGDGVPQNMAEAKKWFGKAAPQFYEGGRNAMKSSTGGQLALQLFETVYNMELSPYDAWSLFHIGEIYYFAEGGVGYNFPVAFKYFKMASDKGNTVAMYFVGMCYQMGNGVPKDVNKGQDYFRKSGYTSLPSRDF